MIPEAAVEALARLLAEEDLFADPTGDGWNANTDSSDHFMPGSRVRARVYLEAAAPHMLAEAWEDGLGYGTRGQIRYEEDFITNPYRPAP